MKWAMALGVILAGGEMVLDERYRAEIPGATVLGIGSRRHPEGEAAAILQDWAREFLQSRTEAPVEGEVWRLDKIDGEARFVFLVNDLMEPGCLGRSTGYGGTGRFASPFGIAVCPSG